MPRANLSSGRLTSVEAAEYIGISNSTLAKWRIRGTGPVYTKVGPRFVAYAVKDLDDWMDAGKRIQTTEKPRIRVPVVTRPSVAS